MSDDILLRFLINGLIDVGGDDEKLEKLRLAASDLAGTLTKTPAKAASFALVAFDPQVPATDPVVLEAIEALKKRWATYVNTFSGTPVAVVRGMLLDALSQAAASDDRIGVAFVCSARNALPFMEVGDEQKIWADVVASIEAKVDAKAESEWATPASINVPAISYVPNAVVAQLAPPKVNRDGLATKLLAAVGPQGGADANPHWPKNDAAWVNEFGPRMANTIAELLETTVARTQINGINVSEALLQMVTAVTSHVESTLHAVSSATAGLQRRTNLLWWKEALYSPSARVSYRNLEPECAAALMALDLYQQVPIFSPASVSAFLYESVLSLPLAEPGMTRSIGDLTTTARQSEELAPLRAAAATLVPAAQGRGPLLSVIGHPLAPSSLSGNEFRHLIGIPSESPLSLPAWANWLFRELQAARATAEGSEGKRRSRKTQTQ